ncbi:sugar 3,4-ketoisomerase [Vibrio cyclitrophicus]
MKKQKLWKYIKLDRVQDSRGTITIGELDKHFDFEIKRFFILSENLENKTRGEHAHYELEQIILCTSGSFTIELFDGELFDKIEMKAGGDAIYVPGLVWRKMYNFSDDAVMLVLCDRIYAEDRVIRSYEDFMDEVKYEK